MHLLFVGVAQTSVTKIMVSSEVPLSLVHFNFSLTLAAMPSTSTN